jgi:hypothetical protein
MTDFKKMTCIELRNYVKAYEFKSEQVGLSKCKKSVLIEWCEALDRDPIYKKINSFSYYSPSNYGE